MLRRLLPLLLLGCSGDPPPSPDGAPTPDGGTCVSASASCTGDVLATCTAAGANPVEQTCGWGCAAMTCKQLIPTGGAAAAPDVASSGLAAFAELSLSGTIDGSTGRINGIAASAMNVDYKLINGVAVFRFKLLAIGGLKLQGTVPIQLVSDGPLSVDGTLDATGSCGIGAPELAGAGGGNGGTTSGSNGLLLGAGVGGPGGGAGAGWGGNGGVAGAGGPGGASNGDLVITTLRGGAGGGAGVGSMTFQGGGGGGAIHLISNTSIAIATAGNINAGGCGGRKGTAADDEGGGGGSGGTIVLEAPTVSLGAGRVLAVNGGGGGGGGAGATDGGAGQLSRNAAVGGNAGTTGGAGGAGGAGAILDGGDGGPGTLGGGGGGGVGRIRINTREGAATIEGVMSPALDDPNSTATQGVATVQ